MGAVPFVGQEMIHRREEEGTEAAFLAADCPQRTAREQLREEGLRQILGLFRPAPLPPHIGVEGIPIRPAQLLQRLRCAGNGRVARSEHHTWHGDESWLFALRQAFEQAQAPDVRARFLGVLNGFRDPNLVRATLDYSLTPAMKPTEFSAMLFAGYRPELASIVFAWLIAHYDAYKKKSPEDLLAFLPQPLTAADADLLTKCRAFLLDESRKTPLLEVELTKVTETVELRLALRARYQDSVRKMVHDLADNTAP